MATEMKHKCHRLTQQIARSLHIVIMFSRLYYHSYNTTHGVIVQQKEPSVVVLVVPPDTNNYCCLYIS